MTAPIPASIQGSWSYRTRGPVRCKGAPDEYAPFPGDTVPGETAFLLREGQDLHAALALPALLDPRKSVPDVGWIFDAERLAALKGEPPNLDKLRRAWAEGLECLRARRWGPQALN